MMRYYEIKALLYIAIAFCPTMPISNTDCVAQTPIPNPEMVRDEGIPGLRVQIEV